MVPVHDYSYDRETQITNNRPTVLSLVPFKFKIGAIFFIIFFNFFFFSVYPFGPNRSNNFIFGEPVPEQIPINSKGSGPLFPATCP